MEISICKTNKKDGYRQQNVRQRQKSRGLKICSRSILPVRQINIWQAPIRVNFVSTQKDRKLLSQKEAVYQHTCINAVKIFVRILFIPQVYVYLYVGLIT